METPCRVSPDGVRPESITLPESVLPLCERTAQVTDTIVRAAQAHSRALVHEAVGLDPTILDKAAGVRAMDACLLAHEDLVGRYEYPTRQSACPPATGGLGWEGGRV